MSLLDRIDKTEADVSLLYGDLSKLIGENEAWSLREAAANIRYLSQTLRKAEKITLTLRGEV